MAKATHGPLTLVYCIGRHTDWGYEIRDENGEFRSTPSGSMPCKTRGFPIFPQATKEEATEKANRHNLLVIPCYYDSAFVSVQIIQ